MPSTFMSAVVQGPEWFACWDNASGEGQVMPFGRILSKPTGDRPREVTADDMPEIVESIAHEVNDGPASVRDARLCWGYGTRCSAAGYMDCTEWTFHATAGEAEAGYWEERESLDDGDPEAIARAVSRIPARDLVTSAHLQRDAYKRFRANGETVRSAVYLCRGLEFISALGDRVKVEWPYDDTPAECGCGGPGCEKNHNGHTQYGCVVTVLDEDGGDDDNTESLWGIDFGRDGEPHGKGDAYGYATHVEAEMGHQQLDHYTPGPLGLPEV